MKKVALLLIALFGAMGLFAQSKFAIEYGPYLQQLGPTEVTILWKTNREATGWVEVAPDDQTHFYAQERPRYYQSLSGRKVIGQMHRVHLTGLTPGTTYRYRVVSEEVTSKEDYFMQYGPIATQDVFSGETTRFTTFDDKKTSVSVTVVNDIHCRNDLYKNLLADPKARGVDFVMLNGDMAHHLHSEERMLQEFLQTTLTEFAADIPFFYSRGNHETRGRYAWEFLNYFPSPTGEPYYTFRCGPAFFIVLDGGEDKPDSDVEYYGLGDFDQYREKEAQWLSGVLQSDAFKEAPVRIVFTHICPLEDSWHGALESKRLFLPLLQGKGIDLMLCGHWHRHRYIPAGEQACDFPILVNADNQAVDLQITDRQIEVKIRDEHQKPVKTFSLSPK